MPARLVRILDDAARAHAGQGESLGLKLDLFGFSHQLVKDFSAKFHRCAVGLHGPRAAARDAVLLFQIPHLEKEYRIEGIRARTVEPDGTAVEFSGEVFDKLVAKAKKVQFQAKTFTLAGVGPGCIIEYSYQTRWHENLSDALKSSGQYMSDAYAILTARWMIPEDLFTRRARFSLRPLLNYRLMWDTMGLPKDTQPHQQGDGSVLLELTNVPAFTEEPFMPPERMVKSRADFFYVIGDADPS